MTQISEGARSRIVQEDLQLILQSTPGVWPALKGKSVFITGGTGFFGTWLLETFSYANRELDLGARAIVLTRDAAAFAQRFPHLVADASIRFHEGDIRNFDFPAEDANFIIHAAAPASASLNQKDPVRMLDTLVQGTRRVIEYAQYCQYNGQKNSQNDDRKEDPALRLLFTSSGAVYGRQPSEITHLPESYPLPLVADASPPSSQATSAYAEGKRICERLLLEAHLQHGLQTKIARCFSFIGPFLALNEGFAMGNFIRDGLNGGPIQVQGDGTPQRSFLHTTDLMIQLWTLLVAGPSGEAFNIGSEEAISLADLASKIGALCGTPVEIASQKVQGLSGNLYVPSTQKIQKALNLKPPMDLNQAIARTLKFYEKN